jgi:arginyl-tRNA synthetase
VADEQRLPRHALHAALQAAIVAALGSEHAGADPLLRPPKSRAHHFQANAALGLAKRLGRPPREVAAAIVEGLGNAGGLVAEAQVAGPGFIDLRVSDEALAAAATAALAGTRLGVPPAAEPETVVVDYSSPNVAKEMHVGHLRSTVVGDALARALEFAGHTVVRQNHLGDWGTQFGMLVQHMADSGQSGVTDFSALGSLYRDAKARFDADPAFADAARRRVVALQSGDPETVALWRGLVDVSVAHIGEAYAALGVTLTDGDIKGESFYNDRLASTVTALLDAGVAIETGGAVVIRSERFTGPDGAPAALMIRKSDGGYGYGVTDLAALRYRVAELGVDRLLYVTDARQAQHFAMVFDAAERAGWLEHVRAEHVPFGAVLGPDGKPFKTRDGGTVALGDLLEEAVARGRTVVDAKSPDLPEDERAAIARAVGIGAVKYADLAGSRQRDYAFSFERMLALGGNTAPYMQYACVRAARVAVRAGETPAAVTVVGAEAERTLILTALEFADVIAEMTERSEPHLLCTYLFELAGVYSRFYETCPVIKAEGDVRSSRLALCELTARTLRTGLDLLGIDVPEQM